MSYTVRNTLKPVLVPRMRLAGLGVAPQDLLAQLDDAQEAARARVTAQNTNAFNDLVMRANALRDILGAYPEPNAAAELEAETMATIEAFNGFAKSGTPWKLIGIGLLAIGGMWWWSRRQVLDGLEDGDCGCGG